MAVKTFRVGQLNDGNYGALFEADQAAISRADGWTVDKIAAGLSCNLVVGTKQLSTAFTSQTTTPKPASFVTGAGANAFKTPAALNGTFAATAWTITFALRAGSGTTQAGRIRVRVFKSVNADGSAATELTSATQVGTTSAAINVTTDVTSIVTWSPGATITLSNEFLFFVIAWETTTASSTNGGDVRMRTGQAAAGCRIDTPNFTAIAVNTPVTLAANMVLTPAIAKSFSKTSAAGLSLTTAMAQVRTFAKPQAVVIVFTAGQSAKKIQGILLPAGVTLTPSIVRLRSGGRTFAVTVTLTPTISRLVFAAKIFAVTVVFTAVQSRKLQDFRTLVANVVFTAGMSPKKVFSRAISAALTLTPGFVRKYTLGRIFSAPIAFDANMVASRQGKAGILLDAATTLVPSIKKLVGKGMGTSANFIPTMDKNVSRKLVVTTTLVPAQAEQSQSRRIFDSVATLQVGMQRGSGRDIAFSIPIPLIVGMVAGRSNRVLLSANAIFTAALGFVRQIVRKPIDALFSTALDPAQLLGTGEEVPDLASAQMEGVEEETHLLSAGNGAAELEAVGNDAPVLRSVS